MSILSTEIDIGTDAFAFGTSLNCFEGGTNEIDAATAQCEGCPLDGCSAAQDSLSTGAIVGIVVGGVLGLVLLCGGIYCAVKRRTNRLKVFSGGKEPKQQGVMYLSEEQGPDKKNMGQQTRPNVNQTMYV